MSANIHPTRFPVLSEDAASPVLVTGVNSTEVVCEISYSRCVIGTEMRELTTTLPAVRAGLAGRVRRREETKAEGQGDRKERYRSATDHYLFERHLQGDHDALMMLFERHNDRLWLYVARMSGDGSRANDIMQDFWERLILLRRKRMEAPEHPSGYFYRMVRNISLNAFRSNRQSLSLEDLPEEEHPTMTISERSREEELLMLALEQIPESHREILVLNAWSGYSFEEIAGMLGKQPGAIHTTAWRARKRLAEIIEMLGNEEREEEL